jgi:hypothetical protein
MLAPAVSRLIVSSNRYGCSTTDKGLDFHTGERGENADAARRYLVLGPQVGRQPEECTTGHRDKRSPIHR